MKVKDRSARKNFIYSIPFLFTLAAYVILVITVLILFKLTDTKFSDYFLSSAPKFSSNLDNIFEAPGPEGNINVEYSKINLPDKESVFGEIEIQKAHIKCPLIFGSSAKAMSKGTVMVKGSYFPGEGGTVVLKGHTYLYFKELEAVENRDTITVRTEYGVVNYTVYDKKYQKGNAETGYDINKDKETLVIYCNYPFGGISDLNTHYFIYAEKTSGVSIK